MLEIIWSLAIAGLFVLCTILVHIAPLGTYLILLSKIYRPLYISNFDLENNTREYFLVQAQRNLRKCFSVALQQNQVQHPIATQLSKLCYANLAATCMRLPVSSGVVQTKC